MRNDVSISQTAFKTQDPSSCQSLQGPLTHSKVNVVYRRDQVAVNRSEEKKRMSNEGSKYGYQS